MTKLEEKIIKLLADYPEREFYGQEIAYKIKASKAAVSGLLKALHGRGVVRKKTKGRMGFYQISQNSLELKKFRINTVLEKINPLLPRFKKFCQKIVLFGSSSRGEQTSDSDIDLFILSRDKDKARKALKRISAGLPLKAIVKTPSEWSEFEITEPEFYREIKNGIILYEYVPRI